jgi:hypothetical protein
VSGSFAQQAAIPTDGGGHAGLSWACFFLLLVPWLQPLAGGPSPTVEPWLVSAACTAAAFALRGFALPHVAISAALAMLGAWTFARSGGNTETLVVLGACLIIFMAANIGAATRLRPRWIDVIALAWLCAAVLSTGIGLVQYFGVSEILAPWVSGAGPGEAFANLRQRNQFASLTVIGMASLLWLSPRVVAQGPALVLLVWLAIGNAATTSRTGLAQLVVVGLMAYSWRGATRQRRTLWLAAWVSYALAAVALPWLLEVFTGVTGYRLWERVASSGACSSRLTLWSNVVHLIAQMPWAGWGWGELDYAHFATLYDGARFCDILDNAHNLPLQLAVELGVPFAVLATGAAIWTVARNRPWHEASAARQMAWAVLAALAIHSLLEYPLWYGPFQITLGLCLGLLWPRTPESVGGPGRRAPAAILSFIVCAACAYAWWDYRRVSQIYLAPEARAPQYRDPLPEIRKSWLFRSQAAFAELTLTPLTRDNAAWTYETARSLLHYSPEPRVIEKVIESATLLGREQEAVMHLARMRAAFARDYENWRKARGQPAASQ